MLLPDTTEQKKIHRIIYDELIGGKINPIPVRDFNLIAENLLRGGADAVLLGCTELVLLTRENVSASKVIDSTRIHADAALEKSIKRLPI